MVAYWAEPATGGVHWFSILPPVLAVSFVLVTRKLIPGMVLGIFMGGILASLAGGSGLGTGIGKSYGYFSNALSDSWNLQILAFIPFMMGFIAIMIAGGGIQSLVEKLSRFSYGRKSAQFSTVLAGLVLFFDDYANTMVVGSGMRPITDSQNISRPKLAFLVDATSAPIAGLAVVSTWIGYEIGLFNDVSTSLALGRDGFGLFLDALGFRFYCLIMIGFVVINAISGRDFGPMLVEETRQHRSKTTDASSDKQDPYTLPHPQARRSVWTAFIPLIALMVTLLVGFWEDGGGMALSATDSTAWLSLANWQAVLMKVENSVTVLLYAAIAGFAASLMVGLFVAKLSPKSILNCLAHAMKLSLLPLAILVLAWALKGTCDDLATGKYLVAAIGTSVSPFILPAIIFVMAGLTSFATGTSWGTMAILIPAAIPIAHQMDGGTYGLLTMISLGAVLDGSIFGDHCSPISDTTIMSSTATSCDHLDHVRTQLPYALLVGGLALACGYIPAALGVSSWVGIIVAILCAVVVMALFGRSPEEAHNPTLFGRVTGFWNSGIKLTQSAQPSDQGLKVVRTESGL
jgi:Na+/H+ antiporter NhaC